MSAININASGISNITTVSTFRLTNRFYDTFKTDGTINFGDTADLTYNASQGNYSRTTTAGSKVVAYQCIFDKGNDFYVQGLVKSDDGYTTPTLAGIGTYDGSTALNFSPTTVVDEGNIYTSFDGAYRSLAYNGTYTTDAMSSSFLAGGARMVVGGTNVSSLNLNGCLLNIIYYQKRLANSVIEANSAREYSND